MRYTTLFPVRNRGFAFLTHALVFAMISSTACRAPSVRAGGPEDVAVQAQELLKVSGIPGGVIVHVGCGDGRLTTALHAGPRYLVQGLDSDPARVAQARAHIVARRACGPVSVQVFDGRHLPYADNFANLVVLDTDGDQLRAEAMRILCPGGAICARQGSKWQVTRKARPREMDEWSHWLHGPDGNAVAQDALVGPPKHLQWITGPRMLRHHNRTISFSAMVSTAGRVFYIIDDSPPGIVGLPDRWKLVARDAFNGALLWQRPLPDWGWSAWTGQPSASSKSRFDEPIDLTRRLVAHGDRLYVAVGEHQPLHELDAATGKTLRVFPGTKRLSEMLIVDDRLIVSVHRPGAADVSARGNVAPLFHEDILVFDLANAALVWKNSDWRGVAAKTGPLRPYTHLYLTADSRQLYLVDHEFIVSLDMKTGHQLWRVPRPERKETVAKYSSIITSNLCSLVVHGDVVLFSQLKAYGRNPWYEPSHATLLALSKASGQQLWEFPAGNWGCYSPPDLFVIDNLAWTYSREKPYRLLGLDLHSGKVKRRISVEKAMVTEHHHRCYRNKATDRFVLTGRRGIEFLDLQDGSNQLNHWIRGACRYGILPCNGLIYAPPDPCICYITAKVNGMVALASEHGPASSLVAPRQRLYRGPAYGTVTKLGSAANAGAWPTYRHDDRRMGCSPMRLGMSLTPQWQIELDGPLSAPVVAGGRLIVSSIDRHTVHAMDPATGKKLWQYTCAGRVDSPPTIVGPLALFGSADGNVYAVRADDGRLIWRLQAAPGRRNVTAFGQIESTWPVHGSVLVHDGIAFFAAGRSSFLDGGITVYAVDPLTGKILQQHTLVTPEPGADKPPYDPRLRYDMPPDRPGALSDILVSDGRYIYMRHIRMNPNDLAKDLTKIKPKAEIEDVYKHQIPRVYSPGPQVACSLGLLTENWFNQTYWSFAGTSQCRLLVCDATTTYGVRAYAGRPARHSRAKFIEGKSHYTLFADRRGAKVRRIWAQPLPIRVGALLVAGDKLLVAGAPDNAPANDPWAPELGRGPGVVAVFSTTDGKQLSRQPLPAPPIWNGIAAANGRVYLSLKNGQLVCLE